MGISSVQIAAGASSYGAYSQKLTQETRQKLVELGITFSPNITEAEGKNLIARFEAHNAQNNPKQQQNFSQEQNKNEATEELKRLAKQVGINPENNPNFKELAQEIEEKLKEKIQNSKGDMQELQRLKGLSQDLASLQSQSDNNSMG